MVNRHRPPHDPQFPLLARVPDHLAHPLHHFPSQYSVARLGNPDHVVFDVVPCVPARVVLSYPLSLGPASTLPPIRLLEEGSRKVGGIGPEPWKVINSLQGLF